jgi:hypothetical protein
VEDPHKTRHPKSLTQGTRTQPWFFQVNGHDRTYSGPQRTPKHIKGEAKNQGINWLVSMMDTTSSKRLAYARKGNRPPTGYCVVTQSVAGGVNALEVPSRDTSVEETRNPRGENKNT